MAEAKKSDQYNVQESKDILDLDSELEREREEFEVEICHAEGDVESDLQQRHKNCRKYNGHTEFIPVKEFKLDQLPPQWQDPEAYKIIKTLSRKVVKLTVNYTSLSRPDGYCNHKIRGKSFIKVGTGLARIESYSMNKEPQPCPLKNCPLVESPHLVTPNFLVVTATHVVFDSTEAEKTEISFFFDSEEDPSRSDVVKAQGIDCFFSTGVFEEQCVIVCVSHDLDLFRKVLGGEAEEKEESEKEPVPSPITDVALLRQSNTGSNHNGRDPLIVIVSHPHGFSKHVCLGDWTGITKLDMKKRAESTSLEAMLEVFDGLLVPSSTTNDISTTSTSENPNTPITADPSAMFSSVAKFMQSLDPTQVLRNPEFVRQFDDQMKVLPPLQLTSHGRDKNAQQGKQNMFDPYDLKQSQSRMLYSTPTCPGSSGAPILVFFDDDDGRPTYNHSYVHFGMKDKANCSGNLNPPNINPAFRRFFKDRHDKKYGASPVGILERLRQTGGTFDMSRPIPLDLD